MSEARLEVGDCLDVFGREPPESFDSLVQDWPAGVSFMGRGWDHDHGGRDAWVAYWRAVPSTATIASMRRPSRRAPAQPSLFDALPRGVEEAQAAE